MPRAAEGVADMEDAAAALPGGGQEEEEDLYTRLKTLQRQARVGAFFFARPGSRGGQVERRGHGAAGGKRASERSLLTLRPPTPPHPRLSSPRSRRSTSKTSRKI